MMRINARPLPFFQRPVHPRLTPHAARLACPSPFIDPRQVSVPKCQVRYQSAQVLSNSSLPPDIFDIGATKIPAIEKPATLPPQSYPETPAAVSSHAQHQQRPLPVSCPGCGALSQETAPDEAGYYTRSRKAVKHYLRSLRDAEQTSDPTLDHEDIDQAAEVDDTEPLQTLAALEEKATGTDTSESKPLQTPMCDRCHDLIFNSRGTSIAHPTIEAIADSIAESPFRRNHVYHVIDAADFPLSLIPSIFKSLSLARPRSQNRRSQHDFSRKPTLSFIITRSDLLATTKEMVDSLMPYVTSVLRQSLGRYVRDIRLGNVHLVSAKRGWWTADIKNSIWKRGGGNWMVGKVNVGKSNLFEVLFPKGSGERAPSYAELERDADTDLAKSHGFPEASDLLSETSLLPPPQPEMAFPTLPLVSSLPGTTASPIRLPFGKHKGELIDLPGLARGNLEDFVEPEHRLSLVMTHRPTVTQHVIKPGQSLLLGGGLVRITPLLDESDPSTTLLAYPFVPIHAHVTSTEKAIGTQLQQRQSGVKTILTEAAGERIRLAGIFKLDTDVTQVRAQSLTAAGVPLDKLPFRVYSTEVVIEGVGWVELVCQVRRQKRPFQTIASNDFINVEPNNDYEILGADDSSTSDRHGSGLDHLLAVSSDEVTKDKLDIGYGERSAFEFPQVEIHTPNGGHLGKRKPMGAWLLLESGRKRKAKKAVAGARPRKSMKGAKKRVKAEARARETAASAITSIP